MKNILYFIITICLIVMGFYVIESLSSPQKIEYFGHEYIKFNNEIIHSPNCKRCDSIQNSKLDKLVGSLKMGEE